VMNGQDGIDRVAYWESVSAIVVDLQYFENNTGEAAGDRYVDVENLQGGNFDDDLRGDAGHNAIWGNAGNDTINGRGGDDRLFGGGGADVFVFSTNSGRDTVFDFQTGLDALDFSLHAAVNDISDLILTQTGAHTQVSVITQPQTVIVIRDTRFTDITADDFLF